jgi:hypothetical protein
MTTPPKVYDITKVTVTIDCQNANPTNIDIAGIDMDGFGMTPLKENTKIEGIQGPLGFNVDPTDAADATLVLSATAKDGIDYLRQLVDNNYVFSLSITGDDADQQRAQGFATRKLLYCMVKTPPEWSTNEKNAPALTYEIIGYGFSETPAPDAA